MYSGRNLHEMVGDAELKGLLRDAIVGAAGLDRRTTGRFKPEPVHASRESVRRLRLRFLSILREIPEHHTVLDIVEALDPEDDGVPPP